jgi:hypothetical protein
MNGETCINFERRQNIKAEEEGPGRPRRAGQEGKCGRITLK